MQTWREKKGETERLKKIPEKKKKKGLSPT